MDLDRLIERRKADGATMRGPLVVEEWLPDCEGVYATKWTLSRQKQLKSYGSNDDPEGFGEVVYRFALTADGERMFSNIGHRDFLCKHESSAIVERIALFVMNSQSSEDVEDIEGN